MTRRIALAVVLGLTAATLAVPVNVSAQAADTNTVAPITPPPVTTPEVAPLPATMPPAETTATNQPAAKPAKKKVHPDSTFKGKLDAMDDTNKTITVGKKTYQVTSETRIFTNGAPAIMADGVLGRDVHGTYKKSSGKLDALTVHFGSVTDAPAPAKSSKKKTKKSATETGSPANSQSQTNKIESSGMN